MNTLLDGVLRMNTIEGATPAESKLTGDDYFHCFHEQMFLLQSKITNQISHLAGSNKEEVERIVNCWKYLGGMMCIDDQAISKDEYKKTFQEKYLNVSNSRDKKVQELVLSIALFKINQFN